MLELESVETFYGPIQALFGLSMDCAEGQVTTLIGRNGEDFFFLTNEERDISREIKDVDLSSAEEAKFLGELIFEDVLKGVRKHRFPDNNKDFGINRLCDLHPYGTRTDGDLVLSVVTPLADEYALYDILNVDGVLGSLSDNGLI